MIRAGQARVSRKRYLEMAPVLNEQSRRRFVALEARALGRGGVSLMARISGLSRSTIYHGLSDIRYKISAPPGRVRKRAAAARRRHLRIQRLRPISRSWSSRRRGAIRRNLKVRAELDENKYPKGVKVSDAQMAALNLSRYTYHGDWNYTISPRAKKKQRGRPID
jgi:Rhodopirellula transposase DDE domain